jgi:hypothetical protein
MASITGFASIVADFTVVSRQYSGLFKAARIKCQGGDLTRAGVMMPGDKLPTPLTPTMVSDLAAELLEAAAQVADDALALAALSDVADLLGSARYYFAEYAKANLPKQRKSFDTREELINTRADALRSHYLFAAK